MGRSPEDSTKFQVSFLLVFHGIALSRTVSETNGDFSRKSQNFPTCRVLNAPAVGVPVEFYNGGSAPKASVLSLPDGGKSLTKCTFV